MKTVLQFDVHLMILINVDLWYVLHCRQIFCL